MPEHISPSYRESTPWELAVRLQDPEVQVMLNNHLREMAAAGVLRAYTKILKVDRVAMEQLSQMRERTPGYSAEGLATFMLSRYDEQQTLSFEGPILVSRETTQENHAVVGSYEEVSYSLKKVNMETGQAVEDSRVEAIYEANPDNDEVDFLELGPEALEMIRRHYTEQVVMGIVFRGQYPEETGIY